MHTDPIADMLTRIRNAQAVGKEYVICPYSKIKFALANLLKDEGWIEYVDRVPAYKLPRKECVKYGIKNKNFEYIKIGIKYEHGQPKIKSIRRISKPGRRIYVKKDELPYVRNDRGIAVISTPKGLMTNKQARKEGIGGEYICEVY